MGTHSLRGYVFGHRHVEAERVAVERQCFVEPIDVVCIKTCPMDEHGFFNFGGAVTYQKAMTERARLLVVETCASMPHVYGAQESVHVSEVDYVIEGGLPRPAEGSGAPEGLQILGLGMSSLKEESADIPADDQFLSDEDARFVARTLVGNDGPEAVDKVKRGAGMIVNFPMGEGEVFHAGTCEWVAGLLRQDAMVGRVTANVLDRYLGRR